MKYEWRKQETSLYGAKKDPMIITVPAQKFITIHGKGNPNQEDFAQRIGILYSLSYQVKNLCRSHWAEAAWSLGDTQYCDYTVFPLEGVWTSSNEENHLDKDSFEYTIMIKQPDAVTETDFRNAFELVQKKKPHPLLEKAGWDIIEDGICVQILHIGSFDDEPASFAKIEQFMKEHGMERKNRFHREIYLNDARKTPPEKRCTILRLQAARTAEGD